MKTYHDAFCCCDKPMKLSCDDDGNVAVEESCPDHPAIRMSAEVEAMCRQRHAEDGK